MEGANLVMIAIKFFNEDSSPVRISLLSPRFYFFTSQTMHPEYLFPETAFTNTKNSIHIDGFGEMVLPFQK